MMGVQIPPPALFVTFIEYLNIGLLYKRYVSVEYEEI